MQHPFNYLFRCFELSVFSVCCLAEQQPDLVHVGVYWARHVFLGKYRRISPFVSHLFPPPSDLRIVSVNFNAGADSKF